MLDSDQLSCGAEFRLEQVMNVTMLERSIFQNFSPGFFPSGSLDIPDPASMDSSIDQLSNQH